jgi:hypothetical protein
MIRNAFILAVLLMGAAPLMGQSTQTNKSQLPTSKGIIYNHELAYNIKLATNRGFTIGIEKGRLRSYDRTTYYHLSLGQLFHPREVRQGADPQTRYRPYVFGKQNHVFVLRGGWGTKRYFSEKAKTKGVAMGVSYSAGPTLGLLKPYYLVLRYPIPDNPGRAITRFERYSDENAEAFLNNSFIVGAAPFGQGMRELRPIPGGNASIALHMDWGAYDDRVKAFAIGMMVDVFAAPVPMLIGDNNTPIFINFFASVQFGKRR